MQPLAAPVPDLPAHHAEQVRDIPRNCPCIYAWDETAWRWTRTGIVPGCPWHYQNGSY